MCSALIALPFAALLLGPAQSQFTPARQPDTMRFRDMDGNNDGVIVRTEWRGSDRSFEVHDWNGDGVLSGDEVRTGALRPLRPGQQDTGIVDDREDTFENLDHNQNGQIERTEWHASDDAFRWLDRNRDGLLSRGEVVGSTGRSAVRRDRDPRDPGASAVGTTGGAAVQRTGPNCDDNAARVVDDVYQQVLERPADQASAGFTQALISGRMTVRDIVAQLAKSEEHATRYFWRPVISSVYREILNREPSDEEVRQATADLSAGRREMIDVIARSARRAATSDEEAVKILYRQLLGRDADPQGLRGYTELARRDGIEAVARDITRSDEYRRKTGGSWGAVDEKAYENAARTLYRHMLGRDPDAVMTQRLAQMAATSGFDAVADAIVNSPDYQRLYGDDVVPGSGRRYCGR
jgi:hypothetical protein